MRCIEAAPPPPPEGTVDLPTPIRALNIAFAVATVGPDGRVRHVNARFLDLYGWTFEQAEDRELEILARHDGPGGADDAVWHALGRGEVRTIERHERRRDGSAFSVRAVCTPILSSAGTLVEVVVILTDITSDELRAADERGQIAAAEASQAVLHLALDGTIERANAHFQSITGYRAEDLIGRHHRLLLHPDMSGPTRSGASGRRSRAAPPRPASSGADTATDATCGCRQATTRSWTGPAVPARS